MGLSISAGLLKIEGVGYLYGTLSLRFFKLRVSAFEIHPFGLKSYHAT